MARRDTVEAPGFPPARENASFQFVIKPDQVPWINAALLHTHELPLYEGPFPEPFKDLKIAAARMQDQLMIAA
ncbi:hypothetical protein HY024_03540, partial [Candidatus Curtissbacteria bacterium]|nr:hypothetical protein [Candidatus Curtissbacteria bacterium]